MLIKKYNYNLTNQIILFNVYSNTFVDVTEAEIWNIIKLSPVKSCEPDPLPGFCRTISNFAIISKVIEKVISGRLNEFNKQ